MGLFSKKKKIKAETNVEKVLDEEIIIKTGVAIPEEVLFEEVAIYTRVKKIGEFSYREYVLTIQNKGYVFILNGEHAGKILKTNDLKAFDLYFLSSINYCRIENLKSALLGEKINVKEVISILEAESEKNKIVAQRKDEFSKKIWGDALSQEEKQDQELPLGWGGDL